MTWISKNLVWVGLLGMGVPVFLHHQIDLWRTGRSPLLRRRTQSSRKTLRDPVTGDIIDPGKAVKVAFNGETLFFESDATYKRFMAAPERYPAGRHDDG
jgi:YHS domain-containing protein